jgi:hypothetical protein
MDQGMKRVDFVSWGKAQNQGPVPCKISSARMRHQEGVPAVMIACSSDMEAPGRKGATRSGDSDWPRKTLAAAQRLSVALHFIVYSITEPKTVTCNASGLLFRVFRTVCSVTGPKTATCNVRFLRFSGFGV